MPDIFGWLAKKIGRGEWPSVETAEKILGREKIIRMEEVTLNDGRRPSKALVPFSEKILQRCAKENGAGKSDWWLVYANGFSLADQLIAKGSNPASPVCFDPRFQSWRENGSSDSWLEKKIQPGYYLLNMKCSFGGASWGEQEKMIRKAGRIFLRADETVLAEVLFSIFLLRGKRCLESEMHWGSTAVENGIASASGCHVRMGLFGKNGLVILNWSPLPKKDWNGGNEKVGVVLSVKQFS